MISWIGNGLTCTICSVLRPHVGIFLRSPSRDRFQGTQLSRCLVEFPSDTSSRSCDWTNHWQIKSCRTTCAWKMRRLH